MSTLFDEITVGKTRTPNRIALAPMTRNRAGEGGTATELMAEYYGQRASGGLLITEGIQPSPIGQGYPATPGLHTEEQVESWQQVTGAVREAGAAFFAQIMHAGRVSHPDLHGEVPVAPSAIRLDGQAMTPSGLKDHVTPRELTEAEIGATIQEFVDAARNAVEAGFDGVELHGANGYLIQQFLSVSANQRTDAWGGDVRGRIRFAVEAVRAVAEAIGAERTALRISPTSTYQDIDEGDSRELHLALLRELAELPLAYLHVVEAPGQRELTTELRAAWPGVLMLNPHRDADPSHPHEAGQDALDHVGADLVSFGSSYLANPDLPRRLAAQGPYNTGDHATFYGGDHVGYTDYPALEN